MAWRWISTPLSADRGEVSVLAIVETIVAMSISLGIAWYWQTLIHIAVSACLAPFLLLRSKRSNLIGILALEFLFQKSMRLTEGYKIGEAWNVLKVIMVTIIGFLLFPILSRFYAIINQIIIFPGKTICRLPANWFRAVFCLDGGNLPEFIPGIERVKDRDWISEKHLDELAINNMISKVWVNFNAAGLPEKFELLFSSLLFVPGALFTFLFSYIYRWSLKSTALVWSPLLWIIATAQTIGPVRFRLQNICNTALYKIMRWYSVAALILFAWKLVIWLGPQTVILNSNLQPLLEPFIEPARLPLWQVGSAASALLALGLYLLADWHFQQIEADRPDRSSEQAIKWQIGAITVVRNTLALYTIACTLYIAWKISAGIEWPMLEFVLFPWS